VFIFCISSYFFLDNSGTNIGGQNILLLPMANSRTYPPLTSKLSIAEIDSLKNIMRPFQIRNPYVFVGCWALKKKKGDAFYKKRFVWIDPFEKLFFWSKIEQCITPTVNINMHENTGYSPSDHGQSMAGMSLDENPRFKLFAGGSRIPRNLQYYERCHLAKTKCISFANVIQIEVSESSMHEIRSDHKPIRQTSSPALLRSKKCENNPSPPLSAPTHTGSPGSPLTTKSNRTHSSSGLDESFDIEEILTAAPMKKRRSSIFNLFGPTSASASAAAAANSPKKPDIAGRPPTHPSPAIPGDSKNGHDGNAVLGKNGTVEDHAPGDYFKFKLRLKGGDEIDLKVI
jgi:hypothetical protein